MNIKLIVLAAALSCILFIAKDKISDHSGSVQVQNLASASKQEHSFTFSEVNESPPAKFFINDTTYTYDELRMDWFPAEKENDYLEEFSAFSEPIEVEWKTLMDIEYRLQFDSIVGAEIYVPVFSKAVKKLHKKEVIIEGFVIPLDDEGEFLALSYNPFASCFFCGKGSPASVITMYLKEKGKRYKTDDHFKFRGILYLNWDDPEEFYYIFRDVVEQ